jgi:YesN/AraC family two-component response regulator
MTYRILIVDDEPIVRKGLLSFDWERYGFEAVAACESGRVALEWLQNNRVELVLTDIKMPGIDGVELSGIIHEKYPDILVVLLTGYNEFAYAQQAIRTGVFDYLLKPAEDSDFENVLVKSYQAIQQKEEQRKLLDWDKVSGLLKRMIVFASRIHGMQQKAMDETIGDILTEVRTKQIPDRQQKQLIAFLLSALETELAKHSLFPFDEWAVEKEGAMQLLESTDVSIGLGQRELSTLCEFIYEVNRRNSVKRESAKLDEALQYIHENCGGVLSLDVIAERLDMHPNTFSKWFKDHKGVNFLDYVTRYRIDRSKQLLEKTELKTGEIAEAVGFNDPRYFGQVFKKLVEVTPSEYRALFK